MTLGELIDFLEKEDSEKILAHGLNQPHSYRGYYNELAFEYCEATSVRDMLRLARNSLDRSFRGYKGGNFTMNAYTTVWLANYGCTGEGIGPVLLRLMLDA